MMNFCKNCQWCVHIPPIYKANVKERFICHHPQAQVLDIVRGNPIIQSCQQVRAGKCGKQGKWFVIKEMPKKTRWIDWIFGRA